MNIEQLSPPLSFYLSLHRTSYPALHLLLYPSIYLYPAIHPLIHSYLLYSGRHSITSIINIESFYAFNGQCKVLGDRATRMVNTFYIILLFLYGLYMVRSFYQLTFNHFYHFLIFYLLESICVKINSNGFTP